MIKLLHEFLLDADKDANRTLKIRGIDGEFLKLDADLEEFELATQVGTVAFIPSAIDTKYIYDTPLNIGDTVICHFHVIRDKFEVKIEGKPFYRCPYYQLWAKVQDEKIIPLEEYIFVEPIVEEESDLFCGKFQSKLYQEEIKSTGIVFAPSKMAEASGIKMGDKVFVTQNAECEITLFGKKLWRMRIRNIVGIEREGELICLNGKVLIKELEADKKVTSFEMPDEEKKEKKGVVMLSDIPEVNIDDKISYHNGVDTLFLYKKEKYSYINQDNINYIQ